MPHRRRSLRSLLGPRRHPHHRSAQRRRPHLRGPGRRHRQQPRPDPRQPRLHRRCDRSEHAGRLRPRGLTSDNTPTFGFSSNDGTATFECRIDADPFAACSGPGDTHTTAALSDGAHTFEVRAVDTANNPDPTPASRGFTVDATAPNTQVDSGPSGLTSDNTPTFGFSSNDGTATFECRIDADPFAACSGPGDTHTTAALSDGAHTFEVRAVDTANNPDPTPASRSFTVDTNAPETQIDSGPSGTTNDAGPSFTFSSPDNSASFQCRLDSNNAADWASCSSPKAYSSLADGTHTFEVRAVDTAGNPDPTPASRTFTVDTNAPQDPDRLRPLGDHQRRRPELHLLLARQLGELPCRLDSNNAADWASCSSPKAYSSLADGTHTFEVRAVDTAGNPDPTPASRTFTVDTTPAPAAPTITATGPASPANNNSPKVKGTAAAGTTVKIYASGTCSGSPVAQGSAGAFASPGITVSVADNTTTQFSATATDASGRTSACSNSLTYVEDSTPPAAPTITATGPASQQQQLPQGQGHRRGGHDGEDLHLRHVLRITHRAPRVTAGAFASPGITVSVADNTTTQFRARATDAAGNTSACSNSLTYVEDSTPPAAPTITATGPASPANNNSPKVKGTAAAGTTVKFTPPARAPGPPRGTGLRPAPSPPRGSRSPWRTTRRPSSALGHRRRWEHPACSGTFKYVEELEPARYDDHSGPIGNDDGPPANLLLQVERKQLHLQVPLRLRNVPGMLWERER